LFPEYDGVYEPFSISDNTRKRQDVVSILPLDRSSLDMVYVLRKG
jgi:hypothetical protein